MRLKRRQAEVYFAFFGIFLEPFDIQIILLGIFPTNSTIGTGEGAIGAGEGGSSGRFAPKNGRNCQIAQGSGGKVRRRCAKGQGKRSTPHPAQRINKVF
jgi:hypothetical protein